MSYNISKYYLYIYNKMNNSNILQEILNKILDMIVRFDYIEKDIREIKDDIREIKDNIREIKDDI